MTSAMKSKEGFTLIELMAVLAIIAILTGLALASYRHFTDKAKAVEAEVALAEIDRLQIVYYATHGTYSGDLNAIGFSPRPALKYYQVAVQVQNGGTSFQAMAQPLALSAKQLGLVLTHTPDGQVTLKAADPTTLAALVGGSSGSNGTSPVLPAGSGGAASSSGGSAPKPTGCGGDATVAADGLLDMNFCLR